MRRVAVAGWAILTFFWTSPAAPFPAASSTAFEVLVHKDNPAAAIPLQGLQRIFRKQTRMWPHGESVVPVDWDASAEIRAAFTKRVLNRTVREMADFWVQQNITQGLTPPSTLKSARAILRFVASVPGAIAYVAVGDSDGTVKVIEIKGLR